jgi:hypothetical protein
VEQLPERFRRAALAEVPASKEYCLNNEFVSGLLDCDCFSRIVLKYRIAHANEYHVPRGGHDDGGWWPLTTLLLGPLDCSECISDERVSNWAAARVLKGLMPGWTDADKKFMTACVSRTFIASFRAKPTNLASVDRGLWQQAWWTCVKQLRP